jgi:deferrochelatase/peroxidase EfeB
MTDDPTTPPDPPVTRRGFLGAVGGLTVGAAAVGLPAGLVARPSAAAVVPTDPAVEPFYGDHQGGILTAPQRHTSVVALDVTTERRD